MALTRRRYLFGLAGMAAAGTPIVSMAALLATPPGPTGPFYPDELPADGDNDLTRVQGRAGIARGEITELSGRLLDLNGRPIAGGRIEIWQCDANGRYHHPRDGGRALDPDFQGFGHTVTAADGGYRFRTIKPVPYPGRTPHIHMAVFAPGQGPFVTQLYVRGEPRNADDFLFQRIPSDRRPAATTQFAPSQRADAALEAVFDLVLGITPPA